MKTADCFPYCATFEQDHDKYTGRVLSNNFYCVECGVNEKNVDAYWEREDKEVCDIH